MQLLFSAKFRRGCALLAASAALVALSSRCFADPITLTSSAVSSMALGPSADTLSLNAGSVSSSTSSPGTITFQTGDLLIGNSPIPDQIIPFSFQDTLTLDGITQILDVAAQVDVTTTADTVSIFAGAPIVFGDEIFTLQPFSATGTSVGQDLAVDMQGSVEGSVSPTSPTPEPGSLTLLATGAVVALVLVLMSRRSLVESIPAAPPAPPMFLSRAPAGTRAGAWVRRGAALHPSAPDSGSTSGTGLSARSADPSPAEDLQVD